MKNKTFFGIFTLAAVLRIAFIWRAPLWYDENFTLILARLPFGEMIQATAGDVHPPLWYLIEWIIFHLFPQLPAWTIRIPALLFSLLAVYTFDQLCGVLHVPARIRMTAIVLMSILPMQLWYAQEGRMYAMLEFLVLYTLYAGITRKWIYFTLSGTAMLYTQNYGVFYLAVIGLVLMVIDRRQIANVLTASATAFLFFLPWVFVLTQQMGEIEGRYWIMDDGAGAVLGAIYKQFWVSSMSEPGIVTSYVFTYIALIIGMGVLLKEKISAWWVVIMMAFAPLALAWFASILWQPLLLFRPLIGISPFLYLVVAWPIESLSLFAVDQRNRTAIYASCFALPLLMFGMGGYYKNISDMKGEGAVSPLLNAFDYVRANWQEGDVLYYTDDGPMVNLMPYTNLPQYRMPACDDRIGYAPVLGSLSDSTRSAFGIPIAYLNDVPHKRAWVFAPRSPLHPQCYEKQIASIAPEGEQVITVDDNEYISSGVWLVEEKQ